MKSIYDNGREYDGLGMGLAAGAEVEYYAALAHPGTSALELACGTGRLTIPLAERGISIMGIDTAPAMLEVAQAKAAERGISSAFVEADIRAFSLNKEFDLIFLPNNSVAHLHSLTDICACFSCVLGHLSDHGCFVIDMFSPSLPLLMREPERHYPVTEFIRPDGKTVVVTETVCYNAASQISHSLWHYQVEGEPIDVRPLGLRMFFPQELDALLTLSGFAIASKFGGFDKSAFSSVSRQQLIVCRKANFQPA